MHDCIPKEPLAWRDFLLHYKTRMEDQLNQVKPASTPSTIDGSTAVGMEAQTTPETTNAVVDSLFAVEGVIKNHLEQIETVTQDARRLKEMFDDLLVNDNEYSKAEEGAKEAVKAKTAAKKAALAKPEAESITNKLKDAKEQLKDLSESLSLHLQQYAKLSGSDQLEIEPGDIRQIVYKARLIKSPSTSK